MPYDLEFDIKGKLLRIQAKSAWYDQRKENYVVDVRWTKTNRREMKRSNYEQDDFDFTILYIKDLGVFCVMPFEVFTTYDSEIHLLEKKKRQPYPKSHIYRGAWHLL